MSWAVTNTAAGLAGVHQQAEQVVKKDAKPAAERPRRRDIRDRFDPLAEPTATEKSDAVRSMKDNSQEETREDREEHDGYSPAHEDAARPKLDLEA